MTDPLTSLLAGVAANAITSMVSAGHTRDGAPRPTPTTREMASAAVEELVGRAGAVGTVPVEEVCLFLLSPEIETLARRLYAGRILGGDDSRELGRGHFVRSFCNFIGQTDDEAVVAARTLYSDLLDQLVAATDRPLSTGSLLALDARIAFRHEALHAEIAALRADIGGREVDVKAVEAFEATLRRHVARHHGYVVPPELDDLAPIPLDSVFVAPTFWRNGPGRSARQSDLGSFLSDVHRTVVLGDPGGGKTTLADKICFDTASKYDQRLVAGRRLTPLPVTLRQYAAAKNKAPLSFLDFIEQTARTSYQLAVPQGYVDYLLTSGRAFVIFDGLDELTDTSRRRALTSEIESFCLEYPGAPVIVTSRIVGYFEAPLDDESFEVWELKEFDADQTRQYVVNRFARDRRTAPDARAAQVASFMDETDSVRDLRSNPLMLGLMCSIYKGQGYIPKNRPDVYEKCAEKLFERWDRERGIQSDMPFEAHVRPALAHLAHWIFGNLDLQDGVPEGALADSTANYLSDAVFSDKVEAEHVARQFVRSCRGRAWVLRDVGTTREGDSLYKFTHRTFLEYFTARYLVRRHVTVADAFAVLGPRIGAREWDVVAQLAFQMLAKGIERGADALVEACIASDCLADVAERDNCLLFMCRSLEFVVPSQNAVTRLVEAVLERAGASVQAAVGRKGALAERGLGQERVRKGRGEAIDALWYCAIENRRPVAEAVEQWFRSALRADPDVANVALQLRDHAARDEAGLGPEWWLDLFSRLDDITLERRLALAPDNREAAVASALEGRIGTADLLAWHGLAAIFCRLDYPLIPGGYRGPIICDVRVWLTAAETNVAWQDHARQLFMAIGNLPNTVGCPVVETPDFDVFDLPEDRRLLSIEPKLIAGEVLFGLILLELVIIERTSHRHLVHPLARRVLTCWGDRQPMPESLRDELVEAGLGRRHLELLNAWAKGELQMIRPADEV